MFSSVFRELQTEYSKQNGKMSVDIHSLNSIFLKEIIEFRKIIFPTIFMENHSEFHDENWVGEMIFIVQFQSRKMITNKIHTKHHWWIDFVKKSFAFESRFYIIFRRIWNPCSFSEWIHYQTMLFLLWASCLLKCETYCHKTQQTKRPFPGPAISLLISNSAWIGWFGMIRQRQ